MIDGLVNFKYRIFISDKIGNSDYQTTDITVIEKNAQLDLAVIRFISPIYIEYATVKDSTELKKGQIVPVDIEIWPISRIWHKGQKLRLQIAGRCTRFPTLLNSLFAWVAPECEALFGQPFDLSKQCVGA